MKFIKKITPRSLYGRFLLISIVPIVILQCVMLYIFYDNHWRKMSRNMATSLSGEVSLIVDAFHSASPEQRDAIAIAAKSFMNLDLSFTEQTTLSKAPSILPEHQKYADKISHEITLPVAVHYDQAKKYIITEILLPEGVLEIQASNKRLASSTTYIFVVWMLGVSILLITISILFLRGQVRSIIHLANAAEQFGKGQDAPDFKPHGAREIRLAAIAFIQMRERIRRLLDRRTQMLASVSHDLRTPLTRMKLQLELMPDNDERQSLENDITDMQKMLEGYLDFARGVPQEDYQTIDLKAFCATLESDYQHHDGKIENFITDSITINIRPDSFKRALYNLVDNGLYYGSSVSLLAKPYLSSKQCMLYIDDNGPGIPEEHYDDVFQPFFRLDSSRNSETGGVGLGLSITRDIINRHGGEIYLDKSPKGGLRVAINIPM